MASDRLDMAIKVGAIVSSLSGFVALATLTGGAVTWTRFHGAKLPAEQAVAAVSAEELVTTGAVILTTYAIVSLVAVLAVYLIDTDGTSGPRNQYGVTLLAIIGVIVAVALSRPDETWRLAASVVAAIVAGAMVFVLARDVRRLGDGLQATLVGGFAVVLAALLLALLTEHSWVGVMTIVTPALAAFGLYVAHRTDTEFRWYGVGIFLAIIVYGAVLSTLRTHAEVKLQPIAVARTAEAGGGGLAGLYIAETSDSVLLAYVDRCRRDGELRLVPTAKTQGGRLVELPRSSVEAMSVGRRVTLEAAEQRGPQLLGELYDRLGSSSALGAAGDRCASEGILDLALRAMTPVAPDEARRLARLHRPQLMFDSQELWRPLRIDALMAERNNDGKPRHRICSFDADRRKDRQGACEPLGGVEDLSDATEPGRIIDFDGTRLGGTAHRAVSLTDCPGEQPKDLLDCDSGPASAIYYDVTLANGRIYVDYWWYLRYNQFADRHLDDVCAKRLKRELIGCFDHEGDWEGVTVVTKKGDRDTAAAVGVAAHSGVFRYPVSELDLDESRRPRIFVANGSHASYPHPCPSRCRQLARKIGIQLPETNTDGSRAWASNDDDDVLLPLPPVWRTFKGRWGSPICKTGRGSCVFELGPKSPARQLRHRSPWCHTAANGILQCDGVPPAPVPPATPTAASNAAAKTKPG